MVAAVVVVVVVVVVVEYRTTTTTIRPQLLLLPDAVHPRDSLFHRLRRTVERRCVGNREASI